MTHPQREIKWVRQVRRPTIIAEGYKTSGEKAEIVNGMEALGFEMISGPPLYDNGDFIVIDTVKDLMFAVTRVYAEGTLRAVREVPLDKYEAIRIADEFKEVQNESLGDHCSA